MNFHSRKQLQRAFLALAIMTAGTSAIAETLPEDILEARQESQIWTTYALSPYLRANDLQVSVDDGKATLTGIVEEDVHRDLARQIALGVAGIDVVDNQIVVAADFQPAPRNPEDRTYGEVIDDISIGAAVKSKLLWSRYTDGLKIEVDTRNGVVTLKGTADTDVSRELAGRLAMNTRGVTTVDNQLMVTGPAPGLSEDLDASKQVAQQQISDSWITAKVKSTFIYSSNVDSGDISVSTKDGVVHLSGTLGSGAERALAIELAQNVRGVKDVDAANLGF